jgi:hypothetical protein
MKCGFRDLPYQEGRSSFLKKRSKKLLFAVADTATGTRQKYKSFLVLFFKKERLSFS